MRQTQPRWPYRPQLHPQTSTTLSCSGGSFLLGSRKTLQLLFLSFLKDSSCGKLLSQDPPCIMLWSAACDELLFTPSPETLPFYSGHSFIEALSCERPLFRVTTRNNAQLYSPEIVSVARDSLILGLFLLQALSYRKPEATITTRGPQRLASPPPLIQLVSLELPFFKSFMLKQPPSRQAPCSTASHLKC